MSVHLLNLRPNPMAQWRLIAFPFAGAGPSVFVPFLKALPSTCELFAVHLPGRETRAREPLLEDWAAAIDLTAATVLKASTLPFALLGHSLGALLAREVAFRIGHHPNLKNLSVAGRPWPGRGPRPSEQQPMRHLEDEAFLEEMARRYGPLPAAMASPEIAEFALPILRADLALLEGYRPVAPSMRLSCSVNVFLGIDDPITSDADPNDWADDTNGAFHTDVFPAGHYFLDRHAAEIVAAIAQAMQS